MKDGIFSFPYYFYYLCSLLTRLPINLSFLEVKEAISVKAGNLAFLKKITLEKGGAKFLVSGFVNLY